MVSPRRVGFSFDVRVVVVVVVVVAGVNAAAKVVVVVVIFSPKERKPYSYYNVWGVHEVNIKVWIKMRRL